VGIALCPPPISKDQIMTAPFRSPPEADDVIARAASLRPLLRAKQDATEALRYPTREVYDALVSAGLFKIVRPRRYGGLELPLATFYRVIIEIARGCPNTGWWFALGTGHNVQIASYLSERAQSEIFGLAENFQAPFAFGGTNRTAERVEGGYIISGVWHYCSGIPYASHFMGAMPMPGTEASAAVELGFVVPAGQFTQLDNWGDLVGMKGSGSHSARLDKVFVPEHMTFVIDEGIAKLLGTTPGGALHGDPLYNGNFAGFAEGSLAAMSVGQARAATDEYEEILATKNTPQRSSLRAYDPNYLRSMGRAVALIDTAEAAVLEGAARFERYAAEAMNKVAPFSDERANRLDGIYHTIEAMTYEAVGILVRTASSSAIKEGSRIARYLNGGLMLISRGHDQFEFRAEHIAQAMLSRKRGFSYSKP
jgi:3-hydroxy-9,10-secoandrosta-1,3,5(10)-triene-9,17-dione monooxygenase